MTTPSLKSETCNTFSTNAVGTSTTLFIFDECHRSQFGETHGRITKFFHQSQLFCFTGTPIFAENAAINEKGKRTTKDLFGDCLHKYVITDAIRDENVLPFGVEYYSVFKHKDQPGFDMQVEDINKTEVFENPQYLEEVTNYIIAHHKRKTFDKDYSALFALSSVDAAIAYYELFQQKKLAGEHDLRIATIYTYDANQESKYAQDYLPDDTYSMAAEPTAPYGSSHTRDKLESFMGDYNQMYGTPFTTKDSKLFERYFRDISNRLKDREKITFNDEKDRLDIVIVVNMMLTGFDAKKVNTLYVDKNLKQHGLIQAFSRTNRTLGDQKSQGNILCFRNLKKATDDAITLFSNKEAIEVVIIPEYEDIAKKFEEALSALKEITPTYQSVNDLESEDEEAAFVKAFRKLLRNLNVLQSYTDFDWEDLPIDEKEFRDYQGKYRDLYDRVKREAQKEKVSILDEIDFELELIHRDKINRAYIIKLLKAFKAEKEPSKAQAQKKIIIDLLGGDTQLRSKRELIEKFIEENLPLIHDADKIEDELEQFWQEQKVLALSQLCEEENLDKEQFSALIEAYIYSGQEPIRDDVFKCLANRPSILQARAIGERIINKMHDFVDTFVTGMQA